MNKKIKIILLLAGIVLLFWIFFLIVQKKSISNPAFFQEKPVSKVVPYGLHQNISVTFFWIGERVGFANSFIPNSASAWDVQWKDHFGGLDDPENRNGFHPAGFVPKENPFYLALPYNDFDLAGQRKEESYEIIPWALGKKWSERESMCKNQWVKIIKNEKVAYAQWEDVGPYGEADGPYVFGDSEPGNGINEGAGIDVSPAVRDYLGLGGIDRVDWQFVEFKDVPDGPWREIITTSQIFW